MRRAPGVRRAQVWRAAAQACACYTGELDGLGAARLRVDWAALEALPLANGWRHLPDGYAPIVAAADAPPLPQLLQRAGEAAGEAGEAAGEAGEAAGEEEEAAAAAAARRQRAFLATLAQGMQTELEEVTPSRSWGGCRLLQPTRPGLPTPSHDFALA